MPPYQSKVKLRDRYDILGFISSGTYGRVYRAKYRDDRPGDFAIKKFKPDKEGEVVNYTGISQSACREMALCSELSHVNVINLVEIILQDKCIFMVFEYAEHDLLQVIHHHSHQERAPIPEMTVKSLLWQLLNGVAYLHENWVLHRDLKPANIMVTEGGTVKIGDLGLARLFWKPLQSLFMGDKVVVTIWYRAPELLLGSRHYTPAIDLWAVGCIFAEMLSLRPIFKGEEAKMDNKKNVPFQKNQMQRIIEILGSPTKERWPGVVAMPEYQNLLSCKPGSFALDAWYRQNNNSSNPNLAADGFDLLRGLLEYDPAKRLSAKQAMEHKYFTGHPQKVNPRNAFEGSSVRYPRRRIHKDDVDISCPGTKRAAPPLQPPQHHQQQAQQHHHQQHQYQHNQHMMQSQMNSGYHHQHHQQQQPQGHHMQQQMRQGAHMPQSQAVQQHHQQQNSQTLQQQQQQQQQQQGQGQRGQARGTKRMKVGG